MIEETCKSIKANPDTFPWVKLEDRAQLPEIRACYFVLHGDQVLYIGRTKDLKKRWVSHHILRNYKLPDSIKIAWYEAQPNWSLEKMERSLIKDYKPTINVQSKPDNAIRLSFDISEGLHKAIKRQALEDGVPMADMLRDLLESRYIGH